MLLTKSTWITWNITNNKPGKMGLGNFWKTPLIKNLEDGKLPSVETEVGFDLADIGKALMLLVLAIIVLFLVYRMIF